MGEWGGAILKEIYSLSFLEELSPFLKGFKSWSIKFLPAKIVSISKNGSKIFQINSFPLKLKITSAPLLP